MLEAGLVAAAAWAGGLVAVTRLQDRLIFGRPRAIRWAPSGPHQGHSTRAVSLSTADGETLQGWFTAPAAPASGLVVWFAGRNENPAWVPRLATWLGPRWALCAFSYRGGAGSTGRPSEQVCMEDAQAILHWGSAQTSLPASRMLLVGRSLGSGVAVQLAAQQPVAGLVLLSPPASIRALAIRNPLLLPAVPWLRSPFDSLAHAHQVRSPSLVLLAERDRRVPHSESLKLVAALREPTSCTSRSCEVFTVLGTTHRSLARDATTLETIAAFSRAIRQAGTNLGCESV